MAIQKLQIELLEKLYEETLLAIKECPTHRDARDILAATANVFAFSLSKIGTDG